MGDFENANFFKKNKILVAIISIIVFLACLSVFFILKAYTNWQQKKLVTQNAKAEQTKITFIEGWGTDEIGDYLQKNQIASKKSFLSAQKEFNAEKYSILASKPKDADLEGFLFPDTYLISKRSPMDSSASSQEIIKKTLDNFSNKFTGEMQLQAAESQMPIYDIVILASIIEKETGRNAVTQEQKQKLDDERKIIAGIFYNRLKVGMPLESDATINHVTKKNNPTPTQADLNTVSPYNTYQNKGLPPGPICNPSLSSIMAALYPTKADYFYFLHKQPSGEPVYSKTYEEHLQNKYKFLK